MHNIKDIRKNYDHFAKSLEKRFLTIDIDKIKDLDEKNIIENIDFNPSVLIFI